MISFVNSKTPDYSDVASLLEASARVNHWANRGPIYVRLASEFAEHMNIPAGSVLVPCANGGVALEAMARLHDIDRGRKLRWIGSSFSFQNLGRGYFSDIGFVDPSDNGMLDLEQLKTLDPSSYDGIVVVNPLGLARDFSAYCDFATRLDKAMLIDNAAGIGMRVPDWPWQSFSLHHTKPYGMGEGGLALVPDAAKEDFYALLDYGDLPFERNQWMNNGKLSDIACAFHLSWLNRREDWGPAFHEQASRIERLATELGMRPLLPLNGSVPAMSRAYKGKTTLPIERIRTTRFAKFAKYYKPLTSSEFTNDLYDSLVNIPCHPDMSQLSDDQIREDILIITGESQ